MFHGSSSFRAVCLGEPPGDGGFRQRRQPEVTLEVVIPDLPHDRAQELAEQAHQVCPSSNATRGNIDVTLSVTDD